MYLELAARRRTSAPGKRHSKCSGSVALPPINYVKYHEVPANAQNVYWQTFHTKLTRKIDTQNNRQSIYMHMNECANAYSYFKMHTYKRL